MAYQRRRIWLNDLNKTGVSEHAGLFFMQMIVAMLCLMYISAQRTNIEIIMRALSLNPYAAQARQSALCRLIDNPCTARF